MAGISRPTCARLCLVLLISLMRHKHTLSNCSSMSSAVSYEFTAVMPGERWECAHISSDLVRPLGQVVWTPEPIDWYLLTANNVERMSEGFKTIYVFLPGMTGTRKFVFSHEHLV